MRSKLFVPCSRPEFFAKALAGDADALSFDLEDAVPADGKAAARARLAELLAGDAARASPKRLIVRVNAPGGDDFRRDVAALAGCRVDLVNVPKADSAADVADAAEALAGIGEAEGLSPGLLVNIETPRALARSAEIAAAHPRVAGLQAGLNDLFAALGIARADARHVHGALWAIRLGAGEAGVFAYDGAWPDLADPAGFRAEAELARSLGYLGKSCIHPDQVAPANAVFDRAAALAAARRLLAAARAAAGEGHGAFLHEGRMIDRPAIAEAEALVARAGGAA